MKTALQISVWQLQNSVGLSPIHLLAQKFFLYSNVQSPQEADAILLEFPKIAADGSPGAGRSSKTCPDVPIELRVASCRHESRQIKPLGCGILIGCLGTWDNTELLAVSR